MINVVFNMETADPDDVITLCLLGGRENINLAGVVITPGADDQVNLVKHVLKLLNLDIPVGIRKPHHPKLCVSAFHYKWFGKNIDDAKSDGKGAEVIKWCRDKYNDLVILSGAPLGNIHDFLVDKTNKLDKIVVQGGFAGVGVVAPELILPKFADKKFVSTFNLGGDKTAAIYITQDEYKQINKQYYVSKNVCHNVCYDHNMHEKLYPKKENRIGLKLIFDGMNKYLAKKPNGKLFHDPLAACAMIDETVCKFEHVELLYKEGQWGSVLKPDSNILISVDINRNKFEEVLWK